jgi:hypothetical protein
MVTATEEKVTATKEEKPKVKRPRYNIPNDRFIEEYFAVEFSKEELAKRLNIPVGAVTARITALKKKVAALPPPKRKARERTNVDDLNRLIGELIAKGAGSKN